ncbi:MBL fold metallo-hydrolase [Aliidiomarina sanyensis]|nr:MBL fold metallo-hydrolase [Aliidiomarina sanyensis]
MKISLGLLVLALVSFGLMSGCSTPAVRTDTQRPAHHTDDGFQNPHLPPFDKNVFSYWRMRLFDGYEWADQSAEVDQLPIVTLDPEPLRGPQSKLQISWLGHASFLVQYHDVNVLTDPIFSRRASPVNFAGPVRHVPAALQVDELPRIDYVVISHNHYEHLDIRSIQALGNEPMYLVPLGLKSWFERAGISSDRVRELDWWEFEAFEHNAQSVTITATPSQHWSARTLFDRNHSLWAAWHIDLDGHSVWFAGDTGYNTHQFRAVPARLNRVSVALLPIGAYEPRSFMKEQHVNPEEAVLMHQDLRACQSIAMHWGTFPLSAEGLLQPVHALREAKELHQVSSDEFQVFAIGERRQYADDFCQS